MNRLVPITLEPEPSESMFGCDFNQFLNEPDTTHDGRPPAKAWGRSADPPVDGARGCATDMQPDGRMALADSVGGKACLN
jgi:hypothetical protein